MKLLQEPQVQFTGHSCVLQACVCVPLPRHAGRPAVGCWEMLRVWFCVPPPQVAEQALQLLQFPQAHQPVHALAGHD